MNIRWAKAKKYIWVILELIGWLLFVPLIPIYYLILYYASPIALISIPFFLLCFRLCRYLISEGRKNATLPADLLLAEDPRPPVLYLRSFEFDLEAAKSIDDATINEQKSSLWKKPLT